MYAVIRRYSGVAKLIHELEKKQAEVKKLISEAPGFIAYYAIRDGEALATITVCKDRAGADESSRMTATWVRENMAGVRVTAPEAYGGEVFIHTAE
ncbi:MAG TPA: hypothetical protein VII66_01830 [Gemmatimonadaceae bacterium]